MIARVICIPTLPESVESARRTIESGRHFGVDVKVFKAWTPADGIESLFEDHGWPIDAFTANRYSYPAPCMAAFASHAAIWRLCVMSYRSVMILEHDAIFVAPLPDIPANVHCCNFGRPSFGKFKTPSPGFGPLVSKPFFPGAHGYLVTPKAAQVLLEKARTEACPTDTFLSRDRFTFLREFYPWPIECHETITTIQREAGCAAKHRKVKIVQPNDQDQVRGRKPSAATQEGK